MCAATCAEELNMARRRESLIDVFLVLPWWVSVMAAAVVYGVCAFVLPAYFGGAAKTIAPYAAALCLLLGLASFLRAHFTRRKFDALDGPAPQPFLDPTSRRREPTPSSVEEFPAPPEIEYPEASFQAERRASDRG